MAKYKQVEFAALCGIARTSLPPYIKSGQVVVVDKTIDDKHPLNVIFLQKCLAKKALKPISPIELDSEELPRQEVNNLDTPTTSKRRDQTGGDLSYQELLVINKELENEKKVEEIEKLKKQNAKMDGESIPTEIAKSIFAFYGKSITTAFHDASDNWLINISKLKGLSSSEYAEMRIVLITAINEGVMKAQQESKRAINNIIKQYSVKREVGEHD